MAMLKSRQKYIPGGFRFYQPETGWRSRPNASFESIKSELIAHRRAHPFLARKHNWAMAPESVADELDRFNATICEQMGWTQYVMSPFAESSPPPKFIAPSPSDKNRLAAAAGRAKKIWAGIRTLNDWIDSNEGPVPPEQAARRALACSTCPHNGKGDFTSWFTRPAAAAIQRQIERLSARNLKTPHDDQINVCEICLCPLKLKVHTPLAYIKAHLSAEVLQSLKKAPRCWMVEELSA